MKSNFDDLIADALSGQSVLLCDGCAAACVMDTRGFEKRAVGRPEAEQVVLGPHESFGEPSEPTSPCFGALCSAKS